MMQVFVTAYIPVLILYRILNVVVIDNWRKPFLHTPDSCLFLFLKKEVFQSKKVKEFSYVSF